MKKRSTEYVVDELVKNGVRTFFGVLGVNVIPLFNAIERGNDRKMISCKTELASAYMADGYSELKVLVVLLQLRDQEWQARLMELYVVIMTLYQL